MYLGVEGLAGIFCLWVPSSYPHLSFWGHPRLLKAISLSPCFHMLIYLPASP